MKKGNKKKKYILKEKKLRIFKKKFSKKNNKIKVKFRYVLLELLLKDEGEDLNLFYS